MECVVKRIDSPSTRIVVYRENNCEVEVGEGKGWATIYVVISESPGKGYCQQMLSKLKELYKEVEFGCTIALNPTMRHILRKLDIKEYI